MNRTLLTSLSIFVVVIAAAAVTASMSPSSSARSTAQPTNGDRAVIVLESLTRAEGRYLAKHHRYTPRLADLFADSREGSTIAMNLTAPLEVHVDVTTAGRTMLIRVDSASTSLLRPLVNGTAVGFSCEIHAAGGPTGGCPRG
jgi:hypothetical protein